MQRRTTGALAIEISGLVTSPSHSHPALTMAPARTRTCACTACRYVSGDYRFRNGYCKSNPRKMVKMWAEKEMRNLMRLRAAGINSPAPLQLRMHVLVMEFIGEPRGGIAQTQHVDSHAFAVCYSSVIGGVPVVQMQRRVCEQRQLHVTRR